MFKTNLHWNCLRDVPVEILENLEEIYLKEFYIGIIPDWLFNVTTLKLVQLAGNNLSELPFHIYMLECLEFLDVSKNELTYLPDTIGMMLHLKYLIISENHITELPPAIGSLQRLESLVACNNLLIRLPIELSECASLRILIVSDNINLWHIPERIMNMPALRTFSADRCNIRYLPASLPRWLHEIKLFENASLTYIPIDYAANYCRFDTSCIPEEKYSAYIEDRFRPENFFWVEELETHTHLMLPVGTKKIFHVASADCQVTLYDHCLHALQYFHNFEPVYENRLLHADMPEPFMSGDINNGPLALCLKDYCMRPLYTSYYFMIVRTRRSHCRALFTCNFCSNYCGMDWLDTYQNYFYQVDWRIYDYTVPRCNTYHISSKSLDLKPKKEGFFEKLFSRKL